MIANTVWYLLSHACSQQHVNTLLDGHRDFFVALRQMWEQRLPVDLLVGEALWWLCKTHSRHEDTYRNITSVQRMKCTDQRKLGLPFWLWSSLSSLMFLSRNIWEFLWYSACSSRSYFLTKREAEAVDIKRNKSQSLKKGHIIAVTVTHTNKVICIVILLSCKVIQVCRVLVLRRQQQKVRDQDYATDSIQAEERQ